MATRAHDSLADIGFDAHFEAALSALGGSLTAARIAIAHGESYVAWTAQGQVTAIITGNRQRWAEAIERPQVGDWVAGTQPDPSAPFLIEHLLPRRTCLLRRAAGERITAQVIAANVDVVGIVSALGDGEPGARSRRLVNEQRLRRYLTAVEQSGAQAVFVMNKCDLSPDVEAVSSTLERLFPGVPRALTSGASGAGLEELARWLHRGKTLALVGMSGVGKSTLVNALLGQATQSTQEVRERDARGRHTTTHRELFLLEDGSLLIDTPGMRELGLWEADASETFSDLATLAESCRFNDCRHEREPGCGIQLAIVSGGLAAERFAEYKLYLQKLGAPQNHPRGVDAQRARGTPRTPPRRSR